MLGDTDEGLCSREPDSTAINTGDYDSVAVNSFSQCLGDLETFSVCIKFGVGCCCHNVCGSTPYWAKVAGNVVAEAVACGLILNDMNGVWILFPP